MLHCQALARDILERSRDEQEEIKIKELEETILKLRVSPVYIYRPTLEFWLHVLHITRLGDYLF